MVDYATLSRRRTDYATECNSPLVQMNDNATRARGQNAEISLENVGERSG